MINLLKETKAVLKENNKAIEDIQWCGSRNFGWFSREDFIEISNVKYDRGFGAQRVAKDLLIVGDGWFLERHEYDGSEWWEYKEIPSCPAKYQKPDKVVDGDSMWESLYDMNNQK